MFTLLLLSVLRLSVYLRALIPLCCCCITGSTEVLLRFITCSCSFVTPFWPNFIVVQPLSAFLNGIDFSVSEIAELERRVQDFSFPRRTQSVQGTYREQSMTPKVSVEDLRNSHENLTSALQLSSATATTNTVAGNPRPAGNNALSGAAAVSGVISAIVSGFDESINSSSNGGALNNTSQFSTSSNNSENYNNNQATALHHFKHILYHHIVAIKDSLHDIQNVNNFMIMTINRCIDYTKVCC